MAVLGSGGKHYGKRKKDTLRGSWEYQRMRVVGNFINRVVEVGLTKVTFV